MIWISARSSFSTAGRCTAVNSPIPGAIIVDIFEKLRSATVVLADLTAHSARLPGGRPETVQPAALGPLCAGAPDQNWILVIGAAKNRNPDVNAVVDVLPGIEYTAEPEYV